jgi:tRNA threonylcarbamoyladenosine biosynthesis protein TsaE
MPILDAHSFEFFSRSPEQTRRVGMRIGKLLQPGDLVCLQGDLGAGKTTLVQGMAQGWGSLDAATSPTFVLVNLYRRADEGHFFHLDAYRIESPAEAEELDMDALLTQGPLVVEWPERVGASLPVERLLIHLEHEADEHRNLRFSGRGKHYETMLEELRRAIYGVL